MTRDRAFLLRAVNFGEADRVVTFYSRLHGKVSAMALGERKSQRRFGGVLQPFQEIEITFRPRGLNLARLDEGHVLHAHGGLLADYARLSAAWRLTERLDHLEQPGSSHPLLFDSYAATLRNLDQSLTPADEGLRGEGALVTLAGWSPRVDGCVSCHRPWPFEPVSLQVSEGGLLCGDCPKHGGALALGRETVHALRALFAFEAGPVEAAREALETYLEIQLGKRLSPAHRS